MRQSNKVDGTKIAQAAKDLNVTSVTIRRYIAEFGIETTSDENGIKVLPDQAMEELKEIRRLKEEGLTNPKVLEFLEENRKAPPAAKEGKAKAKRKAEPVKAQREREVEDEEDEVVEKVEAPPAKQEKKKPAARRLSKPEQEEPEEEETPPAAEEADDEEGAQSEDGEGMGADGKSKHSLTCQTCGKVFEHMNPRLRDCLECYRAKRKERRRGGADRHKNVIQHPIAQQVASKAAQQQGTERAPAAAPAARERSHERDRDRDRDRERETASPPAAAASASAPSVSQTNFAPQPPRPGVRNYRKAIEETRQITGSLKRRLERPDLPEGERRWLEQIYAYQLILHQGWRHLAEYRAATVQGKGSGPHVAVED
jgi:DNA-binding transcriptional MerR regulator